jgi:hypothetical protein
MKNEKYFSNFVTELDFLIREKISRVDSSENLSKEEYLNQRKILWS